MGTMERATGTIKLHVGDVVEVRSAEEILATLDANGEYESLPFMPEMLAYCNQRLTVYKVAHKLCDTLTGGGMRRMENAVHLTGARCDGSGHGGCQAACLLYWKTAWLKPVDSGEVCADAPVPAHQTALPALLDRMSMRPADGDSAVRYRCQATEMSRAAPVPLPVRDVRQFVDDVRTGNASLWWSLRAFLIAVYNRFQSISARKLPGWLTVHGGRRWGDLEGRPGRTPTGRTDLQPGEVVRVKSRTEIADTLDANRMNRGMGFDVEMARHCGKTVRVERRVENIIDERTGRMLHMRQPCVVLEGILCEGAYTVNCPRAITPYWREIWLDRVDADGNMSDQRIIHASK
jgi:hypothetical protein